MNLKLSCLIFISLWCFYMWCAHCYPHMCLTILFLIPLSVLKMGEQLICKLNPTSDLVKKQLSQLRDQWHTLKQTAANQSRALGGARNLQEFNKKVDKLEAWIKEKVL